MHCVPGRQTSNGGSLPPSMTVITLNTDILVVDEKNNKKVVIYDFTVPFEKNIQTQHKYKSHKYSHFQTDIKIFDTTVVAYEVGARGDSQKTI